MNQFSNVPIAARPIGGIAAAPPMTAAFRRPNSAARRVGSSHGGAPTTNGMATNVQVDLRPVTQHGMTGMRPTTQGQGRQFADSSFFMAELRNKITQVGEELIVMQNEIEQRTQDQSVNANLQRKHDELAAEVNLLEGQLADYNLAHDKVRTGTDLRDLKDRCIQMQSKHQEQKEKIDELFLNRSNQDALLLKLEEQINAIRAREEARMRQIDDASYREYVDLKAQSLTVQGEVQAKEDLLAEIGITLKTLENIMRTEQYRVHFRGLEQQKERLELEDLRQELRQECDANLSVEQMRDLLLNKAKEDAIIVKSMEEKAKLVETEIERVQESIRERESQKENMKDVEDVLQKYEALYQRDKAMQEFIDKFDMTKAQDSDQKTKIQRKIVALLEHISDGIAKKENLPGASEVSAMQSDLNFKSRQLDASQMTLEKVKRELDKRRAELEQVDGLGTKIQAELISLSSDASQMQSEMILLRDVEGMKVREQETKQTLIKDLATLKHKRAALQVQVQSLSALFESKRKKLADDEDWQRLESLELKLRTYAQNIFSLSSYILTRKRENEFEPIRDQVLTITNDVNQILIGQKI